MRNIDSAFVLLRLWVRWSVNTKSHRVMQASYSSAQTRCLELNGYGYINKTYGARGQTWHGC